MEAIKSFIKSNFKWILIAILIALFIIALASFSYILKLISASNPNHSSLGGANSSMAETNMNAQVETNITSQVSIKNIVKKDNGDYKYNINLNEKVDEIYNTLKKTDEGRRTLAYIAGSEEKQKDLLKDMISAEIITQYPDLRSVQNMDTELEDDEVQGCIRFKRIISEPTIKKVSTIKKSEDTSIELNGGVACWGDSFTLGNIEDSTDNYPTKLAEKIQKNTYNLGFEGVTSIEIALIAGAEGYTFQTAGESTVLGADANSEVNISVNIKKNDEIKTSAPFKLFDGSDEKRILKCRINDVEGQLTCNNGTYTFKRIDSGNEVEILPDTEITIDIQKEYSSAFPIIWIGNNNNFISYQNDDGRTSLIEDCWAIINMSSDPDNYIVIIPTHYKTSTGELKKYEEHEYEEIKKAFLEKSGFNSAQVLDLYDQLTTGYEYDVIISAIEKCLNENNIATQISGDYIQASNSDIITLSNEYLPSDGTTAITLEYIPLGNKVEPSPGTLMWMINNEDEEIQKASIQYFSIDDAGNIVVANWTKVTTTIENFSDTDGNRDNYTLEEGFPTETIEYTLMPVKVNYKSSISSYTVPFDYLWAFLVMGEDTEFVRNLTNLTLNSKIEATLYDELAIIDNDVVDEITNGYKTHYKEISTEYDSEGNVTSVSNPVEWDDERYEDKKNHTKIITETNKVRYKLTYADVWFLTYTVSGIQRQEYDGTVDKSDSELYQENVQTGNETQEWQESGSKRGPTDTRTDHYETIYAMGENQQILKGYTITTHEEQDYTLVKDHTTTTIIIRRGYTYSSGVVSTKEKTDKNYSKEEMKTGVFEEPNFIKYYLYASAARNNLSSTYSWLFTALENNPRTESMVDITKYMIYKATEKDLGVTDMDFDSYNESDFKDATDFNFDTSDGSIGGDSSGSMGGSGDSSLNVSQGNGYWGTYTNRAGLTFTLYYQNYYPTGVKGDEWGTGSDGLCLATAYAIANSGYGDTRTPNNFWGGNGAVGNYTKIQSSEVKTYLSQGIAVILFGSYGGKYYDVGPTHALILLDISADGSQVYMVNTYRGGNESKNAGWKTLSEMTGYNVKFSIMER